MSLGWDWLSFLVYLGLMLYFRYSIKKICYRSEWLDFDDSLIKKRQRILLLSFSIVPILAALFRKVDTSIGLGGADLDVYLAMFNDKEVLLNQVSKGFVLLSRNNPLFYFILYAIRCITSDYHLMFLVFYSVITITIYYYLKEQYINIDSYAPLFFVLYFYLRSYSLLKFLFGLSFILLSFVFTSKRKYILSIIFAIIGMMIHSSLALGLFCVLVYIIGKRKLFSDRKKLLIFILASYAFILVFGNYFSKIIAAGEMNSYLNIELSWITSNLTPVLCGGCCLFLFRNIKRHEGYNPFIMYLVIFDIACIPIQNMLGFFRLHEIFILPRLCAWGWIIDVIKFKMANNSKWVISLGSSIIAVSWTVFRFIRIYESACLMPYILDL